MVAAGLLLWIPVGTQRWGSCSVSSRFPSCPLSLPFELRLSGALAYCLGLLSWPREPLGLLPSHPGLCPGCLQACCLLTPVFLLPLLPPTSIPLWGMLAPCGPQPAASTGILSDSQTPGLRTQRLRWGFEDPGLEP